MRKPSVLVIFLTVFIDLVGFGIVLPQLPLYAKNYNANGFELGLLMASFSAMQFVFAPWWGHLSDRIGRRPVLLISIAGSVAAYAWFALATRLTGATALWMIIASRTFAGFCGANITVAQAYIADITPPDQRSKRMGLIGMAFGLGFIFGPWIGGRSADWLGEGGPGWVASALCLVNLVLACFILKESWTPTAEHVPNRARLAQWKHTLQQPVVGALVMIFFLATFCFATFELTLGLLISRNFGLDLQSQADLHIARRIAGTLFMYCGIVGALVQGGPIGKLVKKFGERKLIIGSLIITGASLALMPLVQGDIHLHGELSWKLLFSRDGGAWWALLGVLALLAIGTGLTRPPLFGLLSNLTPANEQGATIGIAQGAGSLARIVGPMFAGAFFQAHPGLPYFVCGAIAIATGLAFAKRIGFSAQPAITPEAANSAK
ncbi:MAG: MFS transporter [Verrucomicrobiae bacterium]|nr:MFS transporter [Verrucomicrobiae bacterium]